MKEFRCGAVVPDCTARFEGESEEAILAQVARHAHDDHGMEHVPDDGDRRGADAHPRRRRVAPHAPRPRRGAGRGARSAVASGAQASPAAARCARAQARRRAARSRTTPTYLALARRCRRRGRSASRADAASRAAATSGMLPDGGDDEHVRARLLAAQGGVAREQRDRAPARVDDRRVHAAPAPARTAAPRSSTLLSCSSAGGRSISASSALGSVSAAPRSRT